MKKLLFSLLFFSAIAWLWIGHIIAADGSLNNISGTTTLGGSAVTGTAITNNNVNNIVLWTNNQCSLQVNLTSGFLFFTNYAAANLGFSIGTNGVTRMSGVTLPTDTWITSGGDSKQKLFLAASGGTILKSGETATSGGGNIALRTADDVSHVMMYSDKVIFRDYILVTNLVALPTNYVAANFAPIAGCVSIVPSNGILWKVTQLSTQLLDSAQSP